MPRSLSRLVSSISLCPHIHRNCSYRYGMPHTPSPSKSFALNLIVPPSSVAETIKFQDESALHSFLTSYNGTLCSIGPNGQKEMLNFKTLSSSQIYEIILPYGMSMQSIQYYEQNSNRGFEDKSRKALMAYMKKEGMIFNKLFRVFKVNDKTVAEWEGVFEVDSGRYVYLLKCKHKMVAASTSLSRLC